MTPLVHGQVYPAVQWWNMTNSRRSRRSSIPRWNPCELSINGHWLHVPQAFVERYGDLSTVEIECTEQTGVHVRRNTRSLLRFPAVDPWCEPNAGMYSLLRMLLGAPPEYPIGYGRAQVASPETSPPINNSGLRQFIEGCDRGIIRYGRRVPLSEVVGDLLLAYPENRFVILASRKKRLKYLAKCLEPINEPFSIIGASDTQLLCRADNHHPRVVLATFMGAANCNFASSDIVIVLDADEVVHGDAQTALIQVGARFRLFGLQNMPSRPSRFVRDKIIAAFGPAIFEIPETGRESRDRCVVMVDVNGQIIADNNLTGCFFRQCYSENTVRNRRIARLAKALLREQDAHQPLKPEIVCWLGRRPTSLPPPTIYLTVKSLEHSIELAKFLPGSTILFSDNYSTDGLPPVSQARLERHSRPKGFAPNYLFITTPQCFTKHDCTVLPDVIINAGGGPSLPEIPINFMTQPTGLAHPLLFIDFNDRFNGQARYWSDKRLNLYQQNECFSPNMTNFAARTRQALESLVHTNTRWLRS